MEVQPIVSVINICSVFDCSINAIVKNKRHSQITLTIILEENYNSVKIIISVQGAVDKKINISEINQKCIEKGIGFKSTGMSIEFEMCTNFMELKSEVNNYLEEISRVNPDIQINFDVYELEVGHETKNVNTDRVKTNKIKKKYGDDLLWKGFEEMFNLYPDSSFNSTSFTLLQSPNKKEAIAKIKELLRSF